MQLEVFCFPNFPLQSLRFLCVWPLFRFSSAPTADPITSQQPWVGGWSFQPHRTPPSFLVLQKYVTDSKMSQLISKDEDFFFVPVSLKIYTKGYETFFCGWYWVIRDHNPLGKAGTSPGAIQGHWVSTALSTFWSNQNKRRKKIISV